MKRKNVVAAALALAVMPTVSMAAPYASNVSISGTNVSFILNEGGSNLSYSINGGPSVALDGTTKGNKSFTLSSPTDTFSITASKTDTVGFTIPTGGAPTAVSTNGLSQTSTPSGFRLVSDDTNPLGRFNSPRGVSFNTNPNNANFGTAYIANSAPGTVAAGTFGPTRTLTGDGLFALRADESDAFGQGNAARDGGITVWTTPSTNASASAPFRTSVGSDGNIYVSDFSDTTGNVYRLNSTLTSGTNVLATIGGPSNAGATQNHGSTTAAVPLITANGLTLYTLDEDLTMAQTGGTTADKNNLLRYDIGTSALPYAGAPVRINQNAVLLSAATSDLDLGKDGKFYLAQNRAGGGEPGIVVLNPDGTTAFDSLSASRTLLANPTATDIFRNVLAMDVSDDQRFLAVILNNSDVAVVPLVNGIPDIANRLLVDTGTDVNSGRDIAFDAADNLGYVSSGQALYRVLSPGGNQTSTLSYNGSSFSFTAAVPEPTSIAALGLVSILGLRRRK